MSACRCFCLSLTILCKILYLFGRPAEMSDLLFGKPVTVLYIVLLTFIFILLHSWLNKSTD